MFAPDNLAAPSHDQESAATAKTDWRVCAIILVLFPVFVAIGAAVVAALLGLVLKERAEATHEGSELIALND